jgi:hypothetical protein
MNILNYHEKFKDTVIELIFTRMGSDHVIELLKKLSFGAGFEEIPTKTHYRKIVFTFQHGHFSLRSFQESLNTIFNPNFFEKTIKEINSYDSIWDYYIELINGMDWYFAYSDDHSVWSAGQAKLNLIKDLTTALVKEDEKKLAKVAESCKFDGSDTYKTYIRRD